MVKAVRLQRQPGGSHASGGHLVEFLKPGRWPSRDIYPEQAGALIEKLRRFIGHDCLMAQIATYHQNQRVAGGFRQARLREHQPLIEAFEEYDKATLRRTRPLRRASELISDLANVAAHFHVVDPTLVGATREHHRQKLIDLNGQLKPLLLEWKTASHFLRQPETEIAWLDVSQTGPEFVVRAQGLEWETECKRQSRMITELVGQNEADQIAELIFKRISSLSLQGTATVDIPLEFDARILADHAQWNAAIQAIACAGKHRHALPGGASIDTDLSPRNGVAIDARDWEQQLRNSQIAGARLYANSLARDGLAVDPVVVQLAGPRRTGEQLVEYLWDKKFNRAASQCSGKRGAVLAFEWEDVPDPTVFSDSDGIQALLAKTFDAHRHVAAAVMRCDGAPTRLGGTIDYAVSAYVAKSNVTRFPEIVERVQFVTREID